jgi:hypothetical protein
MKTERPTPETEAVMADPAAEIAAIRIARDVAQEGWERTLLLALKRTGALMRERDEARVRLIHLYSTIGPRMSADEPTADERAALFNAWKAAGDYLATIAPPFTAGEERERSKMRAGVI